MDIKVRYFGKLTEISGTERETIVAKEGLSVGELEQLLLRKYKVLSSETYMLFKNNKKVDDVTNPIQHNDKLSLMPPFSGG